MSKYGYSAAEHLSVDHLSGERGVTQKIKGAMKDAAIMEGFLTGIKIFLDGLVQCAIDYPILVIVVVALIILNKKLKKK